MIDHLNPAGKLRKVSFTFIDALNDFLPHYRQGTTFTIECEAHQTIKHLIESLGVPHTEVGRLLVNGHSALPSDRLQQGDYVQVSPADWLIQGEPRFILDNHLGQLAIYLRMLGFDSLYRNDYQDEELAKISSEQGRVLLSRDRRLLMRKAIRHGYCIHQIDPRQQAVEVLRRFKLLGQVKPFQRCLRCNTPLEAVSKQEIIDRLEPLTRIYYDEFHLCPACNQIYWKGSHYGHMLEMITALENQA